LVIHGDPKHIENTQMLTKDQPAGEPIVSQAKEPAPEIFVHKAEKVNAEGGNRTHTGVKPG